MHAKAEVAACLNLIEKKIDKFNQNATYTILTPMKHIIRRNSSAVGGIPMAINPNPITMNASANSMTPITIKAPVNLALIK